jgi:hypothetical protein
VTALRDSATSELNEQTAFEVRLSRNDFVGARQLLAIFERDDAPSASEKRTAFEAAETKSRRDLSQRLRSVRTDAASGRVQGVIGESAFSALDSALVTLEKRIQEDDELETVRDEIAGHAKHVEDQRRIGQKELLEQIRTDAGDTERARLQKLVSSGDVITAREYLDGRAVAHSALLAARVNHTPQGRQAHAELDRRRWRAQATVLLPWIEEQRLKLVRDISRFLPADPDDPPEIREIGVIWFGLRRSNAPAAQKRRADLLRDARNALAHRNMLSAGQIRTLGAAFA